MAKTLRLGYKEEDQHKLYDSDNFESSFTDERQNPQFRNQKKYTQRCSSVIETGPSLLPIDEKQKKYNLPINRLEKRTPGKMGLTFNMS